MWPNTQQGNAPLIVAMGSNTDGESLKYAAPRSFTDHNIDGGVRSFLISLLLPCCHREKMKNTEKLETPGIYGVPGQVGTANLPLGGPPKTRKTLAT